MDVSADDFGDAPRQEVPDDDSPVVAAHGQQRAPAVEGAGERHANAVQGPICFLPHNSQRCHQLQKGYALWTITNIHIYL